MADEEGSAPPPPVHLPITELVAVKDFDAAVQDEVKVTFVTVFSVDCDFCTADAVPAVERMCTQPEFEKISFFTVDASLAPEVARKVGVSALPAFYVYHAGKQIECFSGNNVEKVQLMVKNAGITRDEWYAAKERQLDEERKLAAQAAAAGEPAAAPPAS